MKGKLVFLFFVLPILFGLFFFLNSIIAKENILTNQNKDNDKKNINIPMNNTNIKKILFKNINLFEEIIIEGIKKDFTFIYKNNIVTITFYGKNNIFDNPYDKHFMESIDGLENCIQDGNENFPIIYFNTNMRKNMKNDIIFIDSFVFSAWDNVDKWLRRIIYFSTNNYNVSIEIRLRDNNIQENIGIIKKIIEDDPQYFSSNDDNIFWTNGNSLIKFGENILNGTHQSEIVKSWYNDTEYILNGIYIK